MTPNEGDITLIPFSVWFINMNSRYINTKIVNVNVNWFKYSSLFGLKTMHMYLNSKAISTLHIAVAACSHIGHFTKIVCE